MMLYVTKINLGSAVQYKGLEKKYYFIHLRFSYIGLHTVNTKRYDTGTGTGETVPVVPVSLTAKRCL